MKSNQNWKNAERRLAEVMREEGIPAYRKTRGQDWGKSDFDVEIIDKEEFKFDSKYRSVQVWRHHGYLEVIKEDYCKAKSDVPVLFTKNRGETDGYVTISLKLWAKVLAGYLKSIDFDFETAWKKLRKMEEQNGRHQSHSEDVQQPPSVNERGRGRTNQVSPSWRLISD